MPIRIRSGGTWVNATAKKRSGGVWVGGTTYRREGGAWVNASGITAVNVSPITVIRGNGSYSGGLGASVSGGSGSYSYAWSIVSHDGGSPSVSGSTLLVSGTNVIRTGTVRVVVTDNVTGQQVAATGTYSIQFGTPA